MSISASRQTAPFLGFGRALALGMAVILGWGGLADGPVTPALAQESAEPAPIPENAPEAASDTADTADTTPTRETRGDTSQTVAQEALRRGMSRLGWRLLADMAAPEAAGSDPDTPDTEAPPENLLVSPWGLAVVLTLLDMGLAPEDQGAVIAAWSEAGLDPEVATQALSALRAGLAPAETPEDPDDTAADGTTHLAEANAVWIAAPLAVSPTFADRAAETLGVRADSVDFADPDTAAALNAWASDQTRGAIPQLVARMDPALTAVVASALHLQGPWATPFAAEATADDVFVTEDGQHLTRPFMEGILPAARVVDHEDATALDLPLGRGDVVVRLTLPAEGVTLAALLADRAAPPETPPTPMAQAETTALRVRLPRFETETAADLTAPLRAAGLGLLFDGDTPFPGLAPGLKHFDKLTQALRLAVDEHGVEAAAVTVAVSARGLPQQPGRTLAFDRPFLVQVIHAPTGAVLVAGAIRAP